MTRVRIQVHEDPHVVVARLTGDVDLATTATVAGEILGAVSNEAAGVVVDLTGVRYLDSSGIQMLFECARQLERGRQGMVVVAPETSPLRSLFAMTGLHHAVSICADEPAAVAVAAEGALRRY